MRLAKNGAGNGSFSEAWLQNLIMRHPTLLPVDQIEPAFRTMLPVCCELPVSCGSLDNLFVTPTGQIALVEGKLWRNPEARREVFAQIIDYAKDMASWSYEKLQDAIGRASHPDGQTSGRLYDLVSANEEMDEASFHDAVSRNLRRGRFLLLIVGDGIREGVEGMAEFLQQYAGFHFTMGLVELAVFELPKGGYLAQPRVLAKTRNIERGIVTIDENGRLEVKPPPATTTARSGKTITEEEYYEELEKIFPGITPKLDAFIDKLEQCDISPEFGSQSMILRWRRHDGDTWNFGIISRRGAISTDYLGIEAKNAGKLTAFHNYLQGLVAIVDGAYLRKTPRETTWYAAQKDKKAYVTVQDLLEKEGGAGWIRAIEEFQMAVTGSSQDQIGQSS